MPMHRFLLLLTIVLAVGFPLRLYVWNKTHAPLLEEYVGRTYTGKGIVVREPVEKKFYQEVLVRVAGVKREQHMIVQAPFSPKFEYGDEVMVKGKLKKPKDFVTDAGRVFPYQKYLAKDDIYYILSSPTVTLLRKGQGNPIKTRLFKIKQSFVAHIKKVLPRPESSLMAGMLIAGKDGLGDELETLFKDVGLIHIVVLSGYNVTIIAEAFIKMLSFLPMAVSYGIGAVGVVLFAMMAGGGATIVRATCMSLVALLGKYTGNTYDALRALLVVGVVMILINPLILRYDPSFQLSFLATLALILGSPIMAKLLGKFSETTIGEVVTSTLAVEICLLPYILYMNGSFAFVSFPANLVVLPFIPFTMLSGFVATVTSYLPYVGAWVSYPFATVSFVMLRYIIRIVTLASEMTGFGLRL